MKFGEIILGWYKKNRRDLPWRRTQNPYHIWLSEVILQQTRVSQGLDFYNRFIDAFPDVASLAGADEDEVLKLWQGLGYYSRARNLHRAARDVLKNRAGIFPDTYQGLLELKGIGVYTASAIASICFGEPRAVVDGNVSRVIARLYGVEEAINAAAGSRIVVSLAGKMLERGLADGGDPGTHNQAMMEFGALQCIPVSPRCETCPLSEGCDAHLTGRVGTLPVKIPKRKPVDRWICFYIILCNGETFLTRRGNNDIWRSLYQFPATESEGPLTGEEIINGLPGTKWPEQTRVKKISPVIRHQLTHRTIHARFIHAETGSWPRPLPEQWIPVPLDQLDSYPVPRLIHRYMEAVKI